MRRIGTTRTHVERRVRAGLMRSGIRFRGNVRGLPGTPNLVLCDRGYTIIKLWEHDPDERMAKRMTSVSIRTDE